MDSTVLALDPKDPILFVDDVDVDSILRDFDFDFDPDLWLSDPASSDGSGSNSPAEDAVAPSSLPSSAEEIEKFLMEDDESGGEEGEGGEHVDEFLAGVLVDDASGSGSDSGRSEVASPESGRSAGSEAERKAANGEEREEEEEDDQMSRKRRRQMKNRESAMQSRERKKVYVKDLEMKSKYLESECRRLDYALRCCMAENFALHQRLQMGGASAARQESAVLFMESLLLGSLFWLVSTVYLFLLPSLQIQNPKDASRLGRGLALEAVVPKTVPTEKSVPLVIMGRRCRGMRSRMKSILFPLHGLSVEAF